MDSERWRRVEQLYHSALERSPINREMFLAQACERDEDLRERVEILLAQSGPTDALVDKAWRAASDLRYPAAILEAGDRLGPYQIVGLLGHGGMGSVYRANDTRLDRAVAIKVSVEQFSTRFDREARAVSALNHPNICTLHDVGPNFLVMELVEGETLADRIKRTGALPLKEVLDISLQVAQGLEAAHARGIVHCDLKPSNIKITPEGRVKVLDFGLARAIRNDQAEENGGERSTGTTQGSAAGPVLGTPAYMSPEQARGEHIDAQTDVWSFGCLLYELFTGKRGFEGDTTSEIITAILEGEPDWEALPPGTPRKIRGLLRECLQKDRARRQPDFRAIRTAIQNSVPTRAALRYWGAAALLMAAIGAAAWSLATRSIPASHPSHFMQLTDQPGPELYPSLSPDGKSFVYQGRASEKWDIYFQRVGGKNAINLTKDSGYDNTQPAFSPDGERIAFRSERDGGGIFIMGVAGENVKRLTDFGYDPSWSPDGTEIVCSTGFFLRPEDTGLSIFGQLYRVSVSTGEKRAITANHGTPKQPNWSPHGYRIAYWQVQDGQRDIWTVAAAGGKAVPVTSDPEVDWDPVWSPDGRYIYFSSDRGGSMNIWRVRVDERSGEVLSEPEPVTTPSASSGFLSFSRDGRQFVYVQQLRKWNIYRVTFDPFREAVLEPPVPVTQSSREFAFPDMSPDGQWITFTSRLKPEDVFVAKADGTGMRRLTDDLYADRTPRWSPDGSQIAFMSTRSGQWQIWMVKPDGGGLRQLTDWPGGAIAPVWSPDGNRLLGQPGNGMPFIIAVRKPWKEQRPDVLPATDSGAKFTAWSWSADGSKLAGHLHGDSGDSEGIAVYSLETRKYDRLTTMGEWPCWLPDSRRLIFYYQGRAYLVDSESKVMHEVLSIPPYEVSWQFGVSRDGRQIIFVRDATEADIWQMTTAGALN